MSDTPTLTLSGAGESRTMAGRRGRHRVACKTLLPSFLGDPVVLLRVCGEHLVVVGGASGSINVVSYATDHARAVEDLGLGRPFHPTPPHSDEAKASPSSEPTTPASPTTGAVLGSPMPSTREQGGKGDTPTPAAAVTHPDTSADSGAGSGAAQAPGSGTARGQSSGVARGRSSGVARGRSSGVARGRSSGVARGRSSGVARGRSSGVARGPGGGNTGGSPGHGVVEQKFVQLGGTYSESGARLQMDSPFTTLRLSSHSSEGVRGACLKGDLLYFAIGDVGVQVWDMRTLERRRSARFMKSHNYHSCERTFTFQLGSNVYMFVSGKTLHSMVDMITLQSSTQPVPLKVRSYPCAFDGNTLIVHQENATRGPSVWVWDWEESETLCSVPLPRGSTPVWGWQLGGREYMVAAHHRHLRVHCLPAGSLLHELRCPSQIVALSKVTSDCVAAVCVDGAVSVWNTKRGELVCQSRLPSAVASFGAGLPYFSILVRVQPCVMLVFNDDNGVHMAELRAV